MIYDSRFMNSAHKRIIFLFVLLFVIYYSLFAFSAKAASLTLYPDTYDVFVGDALVLELRLDARDGAVNAFDITGTYDKARFEAASIEVTGVPSTVLLESPTLADGIITLSGGIPGGFEGEGLFARIILKALTSGRGEVLLNETSQVILHGENAEPAPLTLHHGAYDVHEKGVDYIALSSRSHTEATWSSERTLYVHWDAEEGARYSYHLSKLPSENPDATPNSPAGDIKYENLEDGVYYFSVCAVRPDGACGAVSRYRAFVDATAPAWINVASSDGVTETSGKKFVSFAAEDGASGILRYEVSIDGGPFAAQNSPYILIEDGRELTVKAVDRAGNEVAYTLSLGRDIYSFVALGAGALGVLVAFLAFRFIVRKRAASSGGMV